MNFPILFKLGGGGIKPLKAIKLMLTCPKTHALIFIRHAFFLRAVKKLIKTLKLPSLNGIVPSSYQLIICKDAF